LDEKSNRRFIVCAANMVKALNFLPTEVKPDDIVIEKKVETDLEFDEGVIFPDVSKRITELKQ
jgi:hypothetical protein